MTPYDITSDWLTELLVTQDFLTDNRVTGLQVGETFKSNNAFLTPITVTYASKESLKAPAHLLHKQYRTFHGVIAEVKFYCDLVPTMTHAPTPFCLNADYDIDESTGHLLMEDLSVTHRELYTIYQEAPRYYESIIDMLALLHSQWWDHHRIHEGDFLTPHGGPLRMSQMTTRETMYMYTADFQDVCKTYFQAFENQVPEVWQEVIKHMNDRWPRLMESRSGGPLTLTHGDVHLGNIYVPKSGLSDKLYLVDWETYKRSFALSDVAFFIVLSIAPSMRRQVEERLLRRYHAKLIASGVTDYTWAQCCSDYRLGIIACLFPSVSWGRISNLQATMQAFKDWNCGEWVEGQKR